MGWPKNSMAQTSNGAKASGKVPPELCIHHAGSFEHKKPWCKSRPANITFHFYCYYNT